MLSCRLAAADAFEGLSTPGDDLTREEDASFFLLKVFHVGFELSWECAFSDGKAVGGVSDATGETSPDNSRLRLADDFGERTICFVLYMIDLPRDGDLLRTEDLVIDRAAVCTRGLMVRCSSFFVEVLVSVC